MRWSKKLEAMERDFGTLVRNASVPNAKCCTNPEVMCDKCRDKAKVLANQRVEVPAEMLKTMVEAGQITLNAEAMSALQRGEPITLSGDVLRRINAGERLALGGVECLDLPTVNFEGPAGPERILPNHTERYVAEDGPFSANAALQFRAWAREDEAKLNALAKSSVKGIGRDLGPPAGDYAGGDLLPMDYSQDVTDDGTARLPSMSDGQPGYGGSSKPDESLGDDGESTDPDAGEEYADDDYSIQAQQCRAAKPVKRNAADVLDLPGNDWGPPPTKA